MLQTRLVSNQNEVGHISIRFFEQVAAVTATIEDTVLKSNPAIQDNHPEDVVTAGEWYDYRTESNGAVSTQVTVGVDSCSTEDAGDLCLYLGALSGLTGAALVVVPEPTSSAVGLGTLGGVLSGSAGACAITEVVDEHARVS
ncbi:hypothetical protein [Haloarchaeobius iranensis]|uniref:hypothetical protein n=1 Tax=Haloarchaeobius iranensis TaxID=996166 RepID=UPI00361997F8